MTLGCRRKDKAGAAAKGYLAIVEPSPWVRRFAPLIRAAGPVLDVACGNGRHARYLLARGHPVVLIDRDVAAVAGLADEPRATVIEHDLEAEQPWPLGGRRFAAVVVVNYLHRPLLPLLIDALEADGLFVYDTFARGNELRSRPRNPAHLLEAGELLEAVRGRLQVIAYEYGLITDAPCPGVKQRIVALNVAAERADGQLPPLPLPSL